MTSVRIGVREVENAAPEAKERILWDTELKGFGLKITPAGNKSFILRYRTSDHVPRKPKIGDYPSMRPAEARKIAERWMIVIKGGGDPSGERKAQRTARGQGTVAELFEDYLAHKRRQGRKSWKEIKRVFDHDILPSFGRRSAEEVTSADVTNLLDKIEGRSQSVAVAVRRQLSAFYSWAMPRLPAGAINPVLNASRPPLVKDRDRFLSSEELARLWHALESEPSHWKAALRLMILTGQRREEVLAADWSEFDLQQRVWTIPGARMKNGMPHDVPLSAASLELLGTDAGKSGRVFTKTGAVSKTAGRIRQRMGGKQDWRWHDIRRTVATGMQRLGIRLEVTEAILAHKSGSQSGIVRVYQRHDFANEKRAALELWEAEVLRIIGKTHSGGQNKLSDADIKSHTPRTLPGNKKDIKEKE
jgi:integrase